MVYMDFHAINSYLESGSFFIDSKIYFNFPWNTKPCEYAKYVEAPQLKLYMLSSANATEVRVRYNLNEIRFKSSSSLTKYPVYNETLNISLLYIIEPFKCVYIY
jgi:hypothetical protein